MNAGATSCTLAASTFGTPTGQQIITIDGGDILKAADFKCTISGTAVTAMTLLNGVDVIHAVNAPVTMNFVDEHYSALTDFVGARATLAATIGTTVSGVATKIVLDTETYDVGGNFASSKFVAPVNGYYKIDAGVSYGGCDTAKSYSCYIYVDGATKIYTLNTYVTSDNAAASPQVHDTIYLAKDSYVELYYLHTGAVTVDINGGATLPTYLTVVLLKETN